MSYQVIARKYRPQRFADVVGQEHVTLTLTNAVKQNRIAHAYLFCGPRGTGKTTIARIFAKCLNCTGGPKVDFDEDDPRCREITDGRSLDVLEIDGASNNGVDQVRELRETAKYSPASSKFKVYIIDEVHMLSTAAFNALLKTLEEPPAHVKFMFATTDPEKVLPTILSRCQRFDLRRIPSALIVRHLAQIAGLEDVRIDNAALYAIARGADGGMRDAESTLDQLISFCGHEIAENDVLTMFGLAARGQILALASSVLEGQTNDVLTNLDELAKNGKDFGRLLADLLNHFRNLLIFRVSNGDVRLLEVSEDELAAIQAQAKGVTPEALTRVMEILSESESRLRDAVSKKILMEVTLLRAMQGRNAVSLDAVLRQLTQLRDETAGVPSAETPTPTPAVRTPAPTPPAVPSSRAPAEIASPPPPGHHPVPSATPPPEAAPSLATLWSDLVDAVARVSPFTRSYLVKGFPVSLQKNVLTIGFDPEFADGIPLVDNAKNHALLQTKLKELGVPDPQVKFVRAEASLTDAAPQPTAPGPPAPLQAPSPAPALPPQPSPAAAQKPAENGTAKAKTTKLNPSDFKNDPLIKEALEVFKGQIIEVRG